MIEINGNQRARGLVNMMDGVEHPNRAATTFVELSKAAHYPDGTRRPSDSLFLDLLFNCCLQFIKLGTILL